MPGLQACFACGLPLNEPAVTAPPTPGQFTPRVRTTNPLDQAKRRSKWQPPKRQTTKRDIFSTDQRNQLWAAVGMGLLPGLAAYRCGQRRQAMVLAAATLLGCLLIPVTWASAYSWFPFFVIQSAVLSSATLEAHRRHAFPRPYNVVLAGLFSIMILGAANVAYRTAMQQIWAPVRLIQSATTTAGTYLTRPVTEPYLHQMVTTTQQQGFARAADVTAPIVALPGDHVASENGTTLVVNGERSPVRPYGPNYVPLSTPFVVPEGHVAIYAAPIRPIPISALRELHYRWYPTESRGSVHWHPTQPAEDTP